jgi:hypothetical protein
MIFVERAASAAPRNLHGDTSHSLVYVDRVVDLGLKAGTLNVDGAALLQVSRNIRCAR